MSPPSHVNIDTVDASLPASGMLRRRGMHKDLARLAALVAGCGVVACAFADAGIATFKNFKHYPSGQWQQELVGYRDDRPLGPPVTSTSCSGPLDAKSAPPVLRAAQESASTCTTRTLTDQERLLEFETACNVGSGVQVMHVQVRAIDDRTMAMETRSTRPGVPETLLKSKVTYLGACPAGGATGPRPSTADCAQIAKMRTDSDGAGMSVSQCAQMPPQYRAQCEARITNGAKMMAALEAQCK